MVGPSHENLFIGAYTPLAENPETVDFHRITRVINCTSDQPTLRFRSEGRAVFYSLTINHEFHKVNRVSSKSGQLPDRPTDRLNPHGHVPHSQAPSRRPLVRGA